MQGLGKDNKNAMPYPNYSLFWTNLNNPRFIKISINNIERLFAVEPLPDDYAYSLTIDDISRIISLLPAKDTEKIKIIILRKPTKRENILASSWGRMAYDEINLASTTGVAIALQAIKLGETLKIPVKLNSDRLREIQKLVAEGHNITRDKRFYFIKINLEASRNTQLYRTIPHEIGHYKHFQEYVTGRSGNTAQDFDTLYNQFLSISKDIREEFAEDYSSKIIKRLINDQYIPFSRIENSKRIIELRCKPEWFAIH